MEFGVAIVPHDLKETAASAKLAEEQGFDYIGIPDSQSLWRELYLSLSVVANATTKVRIGPTVTNALTRHPAVAASAIATLNEISGGRAFLGIGSGDSVILNLGLRPARMSEMREYIQALRALLSGQSCDYKGRSIHVQWLENPVPIVMSAEGPKIGHGRRDCRCRDRPFRSDQRRSSRHHRPDQGRRESRGQA